MGGGIAVSTLMVWGLWRLWGLSSHIRQLIGSAGCRHCRDWSLISCNPSVIPLGRTSPSHHLSLVLHFPSSQSWIKSMSSLFQDRPCPYNNVQMCDRLVCQTWVLEQKIRCYSCLMMTVNDQGWRTLILQPDAGLGRIQTHRQLFTMTDKFKAKTKHFQGNLTLRQEICLFCL